MKKSRPLGKDLHQPNVIQGVRVPRNIPESSLSVGIGDILEQRGFLDTTGDVAAINSDHEGQGLLIKLIDTSPYQPRLAFDEEEIVQLAEAIEANKGLLKPILVRKKSDGRYELIGGERRLKAHQLLGWETISARVCAMDDSEAQINALADNEGAAGLSDYEKGRAYSLLLEKKLFPSITALARRVGVHQTTVSRCLAFMKLPKQAQKILENHPKAIGIKLVLKLVEISKIYPDLVVSGIKKVSEGSLSQEGALRWIQTEIKRLEGVQKELPDNLPVVVAGKNLGSVRFSENTMHLSLSKSEDSERLLQELRDYLNNLSK